MSAITLPDHHPFANYASYVEHLLSGRCEPSVAGQVVSVVAGLEQAIQRQARDEVDIELRLTTLEEELLHRLEKIERQISNRAD